MLEPCMCDLLNIFQLKGTMNNEGLCFDYGLVGQCINEEAECQCFVSSPQLVFKRYQQRFTPPLDQLPATVKCLYCHLNIIFVIRSEVKGFKPQLMISSTLIPYLHMCSDIQF